jgi:hypothetical protein
VRCAEAGEYTNTPPSQVLKIFQSSVVQAWEKAVRESQSSLLEMQPVRAWKAGERRVTPKGKELDGFYSESYCSFAFKDVAEEELALFRITSSLARHQAYFHQIRAEGGRIEYFIGWLSSGNTGSILTSQLMKQMGELGIDLALDIYEPHNFSGPLPSSNLD